MRCEVYGCINNEDGYCSCPSNITIDKNGECDSLYRPIINLGLKIKESE